MGQFQEHQSHSQKYFTNSPEKSFRINDFVYVLQQKSIFQKSNPFWYPTFQEGTYIVREIDKRIFPWTYDLSKTDSERITKRVYAFQMEKAYVKQNLKKHANPILNASIGTKKNQPETHNVKVLDIIKQNATKLRSGKFIEGKELIFYRIEVSGRKDIVTESGLRLLKKTFGHETLIYDNFFHKPENRKYIL